MSRQLRYCLRSMTLGYPGLMHKFLGAMQCPVHGDWLDRACRVCGHARIYRLGSQLLDSPFRCPIAAAQPLVRPLRDGERWSAAAPRRMGTAITRAYLGGGLS